MAFKLKSGNKIDFKMMGSSPVRNMKDGDYSQSFEKSPMTKTVASDDSEDGKEWKMPRLEPYKMPVMETSLIQAKNEEKQELKDATEGKGVTKNASGEVVTTDDNKNTAGAELKTTSDTYTPEGDIKEGDKKWHEKDAFKNTGVGHITDAVKSISRGIKNIKAKRAAKKNKENISEKLKSSVKESKSKKANLKKGIVGPTIGKVGQTKFKDLSKTKIR